MVDLIPMSREHYERWLEECVRTFAQERVRAGNTAPEDALPYARRAVERLLPEGLETPDQWLFTIVEAGQPVGAVWLGRGQPGAGLPPNTGFVYDLIIYPEHRRKGYASQGMRALEKEAQKRGMTRLALHVFGHNRAARALYERLGYETTNITMQKDIG